MKAFVTALMTISLALASQAQSYEQGDIIIRLGAATVDPDGDFTENVGGTGLDVSVDDNTQLGITGTYMLTDNLGLGLLAATPFNHDISLSGGVGKIAEIDHLPPTLTLQYHFNNASNFQPYLGAGINYTLFFDEGLNSTGRTLGTDIDLDNSLGLALEAGIDWAINDSWVLTAQLWYLDIDSDATLRDALGGPDLEFEVEIDPWVYMIGFGYKF